MPLFGCGSKLNRGGYAGTAVGLPHWVSPRLDAKTLRFASEPQLEALRRLVSLARAAAEANQEPLAEIIKAQKAGKKWLLPRRVS